MIDKELVNSVVRIAELNNLCEVFLTNVFAFGIMFIRYFSISCFPYNCMTVV